MGCCCLPNVRNCRVFYLVGTGVWLPDDSGFVTAAITLVHAYNGMEGRSNSTLRPAGLSLWTPPPLHAAGYQLTRIPHEPYDDGMELLSQPIL